MSGEAGRRAATTSLHLERIPLETSDGVLGAHPDRVLFQTQPWLEFIARTQDAEPVVAAVYRGDECVGSFSGAIIRRFGVRILGSPFPGWTTAWMGFALDDGVDRWDAAAALESFAFRDLGCWHLEVRDRLLRRPRARTFAGSGASPRPTRSI